MKLTRLIDEYIALHEEMKQLEQDIRKICPEWRPGAPVTPLTSVKILSQRYSEMRARLDEINEMEVAPCHQ